MRVMSNTVPAFRKLHPDAVIPNRVYADDIGWDLTSRLDEPLEVPPGSFVDVPCDLAVQLPRGSWALLIGRSSALRTHGLLVNVGVIDEGYTGPLFAGVFNATPKPVFVETGTRLSQLIVISRHDPVCKIPREVQQFRPTARGVAAFGSTGV